MRWNSIVVKMGATIIVLLLMVLLPLGYTVNQIFSSFYFNEVKEQLDRLSSQYASSIKSLADQEQLVVFELLGQVTEQSIVIVDREGYVLINSGSPMYEKGTKIESDMLEILVREKELQGLKVDDMSKDRYYFVGKQVYDVNNNLIGGLFSMTSVEGVYNSLDKIRSLILLAGLGSIFLAMGFTYIVSRKLTYPLIEVEKATQKIAKGQFSTRINIGSHDEIGQLVKAINDMAKELHRIQTNRSEFFANISHELRTPITYIEGYAKVLKEGRYRSPNEQFEYLTVIEQETSRMMKLVEDLFELSKIEEGKLELHLEELDMNEIIEQVLFKVRNSAKQKQLNLVINGFEEQAMIIADKDRIEQVLLNLLNNAVRYTDKGDIHVTAGIIGHDIILSIRDTGIGIPEEEIPYLFDRFYRVEKSRSRKYGGTGLGLSIVKQLVELQKGKIEVQSKVGKGTEFKLSFPRYKEEEQQHE
jgi:signal transduction histidine kinase